VSRGPWGRAPDPTELARGLGDKEFGAWIEVEAGVLTEESIGPEARNADGFFLGDFSPLGDFSFLGDFSAMALLDFPIATSSDETLIVGVSLSEEGKNIPSVEEVRGG
jgi:hypothetical protein